MERILGKSQLPLGSSCLMKRRKIKS